MGTGQRTLLKQLYYRYFDLLQISRYRNDMVTMKMVKTCLELVARHMRDSDFEYGLTLERCTDKISLIIGHLKELENDGKIEVIEEYRSQIPEWLYPALKYPFFNVENLHKIVDLSGATSCQDFLEFINSNNMTGMDKAQIDDINFTLTNLQVRVSEPCLTKAAIPSYYGRISGTFHNHSDYSDGLISLQCIKDEAEKRDYHYIGITDHSKAYIMGCDETLFLRQCDEIMSLNRNSNVMLMSGVECEILSDGSLDLTPSFLTNFDYVIIGVHTDYTVNREKGMKRMLKAIENPASNILAHPSSRVFGSKPGLNLDMKTIIDACIANGVAIEINGSPKRLDLDSQWIPYAIKHNATFALAADAHNIASFDNINHAIAIANNCNIPREMILNYKSIEEISKFFKK